MKKYSKLLALSAVLLTACAGSENPDVSAISNEQSSSISTSETSTSVASSAVVESVEALVDSTILKLSQKTEVTNFYKVKGVNGKALAASKRKCTIESSNNSIISITGSGENGDPYMLRADGVGNVTITVTSVIDTEKFCTFDVEVLDSAFDLRQSITTYTDGDDFSHDTDTENPYMRTSGKTTGFYYFKNAFSTRCFFETEIVVNGTYDIPLAPKYGLVLTTGGIDTHDNSRFVFYLNAEIGTVGDYWDYYGCAEGKNETWGWTQGIPNDSARHADKMWYDDHTVTYDQKFKMGLLRDGSTFHFYVDGDYIGTVTGLANLFESDGQPARMRFGVFEFMSDCTFSNYNWTVDDTVIDNKISAITNVVNLEWDPD